MNELAQHIYKLLLESDFAIIPGFGGFIAHYTPAIRDAKNDLFVPPTRSIGFNDKLTLNDGLLIQSYMNTSNLSIQQAQQKIDEAVDNLRGNLEVNGCVELNNLGVLYCDANNVYSFKANPDALACPQLYGFNAFEILEIGQIHESSLKQEKANPQTAPVFVNSSTTKRVLNLAGSLTLVVVAFLSVFLFSTPIKNTEIQSTSYAKFLSTDIFYPSSNATSSSSIEVEAPKQEIQLEEDKQEDGFIFSQVTTDEKVVLAHQKVEEVEVKAIEDKAAIAALPTTEAATTNPFHIIVASSIRKDLAKDLVDQLKQEGYSDAQVLNQQNKVRVSLASFDTKEAAYQTLNQVTRNASYASAWVYKAN